MIVLRDPNSGAMVCVESEDGYDGWEVLETRDGPPPEYSTWVDGTGWVLDEQAKADAEEIARLRLMTLLERQNEAIERAKAEIVEALQAAGVVSPLQAQAVVAPPTNS